MLNRACLALAAFSAALLPHHAALAAARAVAINDAAYYGDATFTDCTTPGAVCVLATSYGPDGGCQDSVGAARIKLLGCDAVLDAGYPKARAGGVSVCAGVGDGFLYFTDSASTTHKIPVVIIASEGVITYSGRYVDAIGHVVYAVDGVVGAACGSLDTTWSGTFHAYEG